MAQSKEITFRKWAIWLTALGIALATVLLLAPVPDMPDGPQVNDKLAHVLLFLALPLPALVAGLARWPVIVLAGIVYGLGIEVIQPLTGRSFELADILANLGGVMLALALAPLLRRALGLDMVAIRSS